MVKFHNEVFNYFTFTSKWLWLYICCYLCLLSGYNINNVNGAYSEADDLINELDRPSEYINNS